MSNLLCHLSERGHFCKKPEVEGKSPLLRGDNYNF